MLRDTVLRRRPAVVDRRAGFGLLEAILALAIAGLVLAVVTEIAGRTLRSWNAGFATMAAVERTDIALGRIAADLAALLPVRLITADDPAILFTGDGQAMAFTAVTPVDRDHEAIAVVEIGVEAVGSGAVLTRRLRRDRDAALRDGDRVVLLSGPLDLAFAYRDQAGRRVETWARPGEVPRGVIVTLKGPPAGGGLPVEVMLPIPVAIAVSCLVEVPAAMPQGDPNRSLGRRVGGAGEAVAPGAPTGVRAGARERRDDRRRRCATGPGAGTSRAASPTGEPPATGGER